MRIIWLLEQVEQLWGGVKVALEDANWLHARGHAVTVLSRSGPPAWMQVRCGFRTVPDFRAEHLPAADAVVATYWSTVPYAARAGRGVPVHFCQGYEGDNPEHAAARAQIEQIYRLPGVHHVTIAPHLTAALQRRFGIRAREIVYVVDHDVHRPGPERRPGAPLRVGLVGPAQIPWKDIATGYAACRLAQAAGLDLQLVRVSNLEPAAGEREQPFPVEWHVRVPPARMGDIYRSLDVFLGTSSGAEEGFFLPAVEAMACGVPCVLTEVPCFLGYGTGQYALFAPARDPAAMAEALVLAGRVPAVRADLRARGLATAGRYTMAAHGPALERALTEIVAGSGGPAPIAADAAAAGPAPPPEAAGGALGSALQERAQQLLARGDYARAADFFAAAHSLAHEPALASDSAWCRHLAGDTPAALRMLADLIGSGVDDAAVHERQGLLLFRSGRARDAVQAFRAAIAAGARSADAYNNLGVVLFAAGDVAGARRSFERALILTPGHADAQANLAALPAA